MLNLQHQLEHNKNFKTVYSKNESVIADWIKNHPLPTAKSQATPLLTIPVVFHVVYKNAAQNIHDSNLVRQIQILNETYRLQNANYSNTRSVFDSLGADTEIEFCFAQFDPQGNPTNGIIRKSAPSSAGFDPLLNMDKVKSSTTNGSDPWPTQHYLNIWICDMSIFGQTLVLGYATFPGSDPTKDGVVIQYNFVGYHSNSTPNQLGRTTVHEVGHWLGMRHIWGDGQLGSAPCDSTDYVDDTPKANNSSQTTCDTTRNTCSNEDPYWGTLDPPDMVENYMDYSTDNCMTMFTRGQKARMWAHINTYRSALFNSPAGCNMVSLPEMMNSGNLISVFPNPSDGNFEIELKQNFLSDTKADLYSAIGQKCLSLSLNSGFNKVNVGDLAKGMYFLHLNIGKQLIVKRIVIQ